MAEKYGLFRHDDAKRIAETVRVVESHGLTGHRYRRRRRGREPLRSATPADTGFPDGGVGGLACRCKSGISRDRAPLRLTPFATTTNAAPLRFSAVLPTDPEFPTLGGQVEFVHVSESIDGSSDPEGTVADVKWVTAAVSVECTAAGEAYDGSTDGSVATSVVAYRWALVGDVETISVAGRTVYLPQGLIYLEKVSGDGTCDLEAEYINRMWNPLRERAFDLVRASCIQLDNCAVCLRPIGSYEATGTGNVFVDYSVCVEASAADACSEYPTEWVAVIPAPTFIPTLLDCDREWSVNSVLHDTSTTGWLTECLGFSHPPTPLPFAIHDTPAVRIEPCPDPFALGSSFWINRLIFGLSSPSAKTHAATATVSYGANDVARGLIAEYSASDLVGCPIGPVTLNLVSWTSTDDDSVEYDGAANADAPFAPPQTITVVPGGDYFQQWWLDNREDIDGDGRVELWPCGTESTGADGDPDGSTPSGSGDCVGNAIWEARLVAGSDTVKEWVLVTPCPTVTCETGTCRSCDPNLISDPLGIADISNVEVGYQIGMVCWCAPEGWCV